MVRVKEMTAERREESFLVGEQRKPFAEYFRRRALAADQQQGTTLSKWIRQIAIGTQERKQVLTRLQRAQVEQVIGRQAKAITLSNPSRS